MKTWIGKSLLAAALLCATALASAQVRTRAPNYDPSKEITIRGSIEEVLTAQRRAMTGVHLKVRTEDQTYHVRLGPAWFLEEKKFAFAPGDQIEITGATLSVKAGEVIIAREVKKGDSVLMLRDVKGVPQWSGARRRATG